ncbi:transcription initiation factor TFIID subunit TAF2 KNAG_0C00750 [Huiozyma naganishii CBS 8797]|uniref:Transcription initiation factor TFIID subunit 2 n=1 Tax=Huiozyma naganishii (strain ATCC MYA-139 / BCRC 22969 / CBS 8797 / KCTC 17520 / NBRC 10181 / NCYC 3082 / Yp74L-3) TaxID=1071383 RepID=J7RI17_HUIN7|nr:hypothetical protein KNAG_0C00750 [Kazachstania naganishii CBS 8797]CCK69188.1 hypothetical protein KNAG_0C00750 [Kazachstania naganishii CBS 8797]
MSISMANTPQLSLLDGVSGTGPGEFAKYRAFKVAHQRVALDVNLLDHTVRGTTDIILIPLIQKLDYVAFNCKDLDVLDVYIENRRCEQYIHELPHTAVYNKFTGGVRNVLYRDNSVEQSHFLREKFADLNERPEEKDVAQLVIKIPSSIKIKLQDTSSLANYTPVTPSIRSTPGNADTVFTPITIKVEYKVRDPQTGVRFDTLFEDKPYLWNAYTTNSEICSTASYWMPCVDSLDEKCAWELEISVPRKIKDIGCTKIIGQQQQQQQHQNQQQSAAFQRNKLKRQNSTRGGNGGDEDDDDDDDEDEDDEDEYDDDRFVEDGSNFWNRDIKVCCPEFSTMKELAHPTDLAKKVFTFQIFNPVAPHHIGWAVASFNVWEVPAIPSSGDDVDDLDDENDEMNGIDGQTGAHDAHDEAVEENGDVIPIKVYTLPTRDINEELVLNSTVVCQRIVDFYSKEFGSYPFTSYALVFLPTLANNTMDFAGMTLCNTRLLYPPTVQDLMFSTTDQLALSIATQWSGVNITPLEMNDMWCCIGMAGYMAIQVSKLLYGNNEFKYRLKLNSEKIVENDFERPPLGTAFQGVSWPVSNTSKDMDFIRLKAPMVLYILDRRMTKTERSFGMSRILPKMFLQAMSGELPNNSLSSAHFQHVCERVNKNRLESFFQQWVYGAGVPVFRITQRYNKKRMVIEMGIRQCQNQDSESHSRKVVGSDGFFKSAMNYIETPNRNTPSFFTGSMTIRIHESDGTPYEHIVELKDTYTKIDIQYNTKYRRMRGRKVVATPKEESLERSTSNLAASKVVAVDEDDIPKLGTVLTSAEDCYKWKLTDIAKTTEGNEALLMNEAFEWIRIDSDFEWLCKVHINQPDYMFASQLRQDGDVEAQIDSIRYYQDVIMDSNQQSLVYSSILTRTAMDEKYFYGVRLEACKALSQYVYKQPESPNESEFVGGSKHLIKIFQELFCFDDSNVPKSNDFSIIQKYFLQKWIPKYLSQVKSETNECPKFVKNFLLDILTYNENSENPFDDSFYLANLISCVIDSILHDHDDTEFLHRIMGQLHRYENLDKWMPSYQVLVTRTILNQKLKLNIEGLYTFENLKDVLEYSLNIEHIWKHYYNADVIKIRDGIEDISLLAFKILLVEGGIKNKFALKYFFETLCFTPDVYVKEKLIDVLIDSINTIVGQKPLDKLDDDILYLTEKIIPKNINFDNEEEARAFVLADGDMELYNRKELKMRTHIAGQISLLRKRFKDYKPLKKILWDVLHTPFLSLYQRKRLFDVCRVMYTLRDSFEVVLRAPRVKKLVAKYEGDNKVVIKRDSILKVHLSASKVKFNATKPNVIPTPAQTKKKATQQQQQQPKVDTKRAAQPPKSQAVAVNKIGILPVRFVRFSDQYKKVSVSSQPFSDRVTVTRANSRSFIVRIKYRTASYPEH